MEVEMSEANTVNICKVCGRKFFAPGEMQEPLCMICEKARQNAESSTKDDIIEHPAHYCEGRKYEPKDVIRDWDLNFNLGNAVKYVSRAGRKENNSLLQDLKKARQYLDFEINFLENNIKDKYPIK